MPETWLGSLSPKGIYLGDKDVTNYFGESKVWPLATVIELPVDIVILSDFAPVVATGANVALPVDTVEIHDFAPEIGTG